jgi:hypothetical protein
MRKGFILQAMFGWCTVVVGYPNWARVDAHASAEILLELERIPMMEFVLSVTRWFGWCTVVVGYPNWATPFSEIGENRPIVQRVS